MWPFHNKKKAASHLFTTTSAFLFLLVGLWSSQLDNTEMWHSPFTFFSVLGFNINVLETSPIKIEHSVSWFQFSMTSVCGGVHLQAKWTFSSPLYNHAFLICENWIIIILPFLITNYFRHKWSMCVNASKLYFVVTHKCHSGCCWSTKPSTIKAFLGSGRMLLIWTVIRIMQVTGNLTGQNGSRPEKVGFALKHEQICFTIKQRELEIKAYFKQGAWYPLQSQYIKDPHHCLRQPPHRLIKVLSQA